MVANGKLLLFSDMFALAGLALSLFLSVPWPADLGAEELDFETSGGSIWIKGIPNIKGGTLQSGHPG